MANHRVEANSQTWADRAAATMRAVDDGRVSAPAWRATPIDRLIARVIDFWLIVLLAAFAVIAGLVTGVIGDDTTAENNQGVPVTSDDNREREWIAWGPRAPTAEGLLALGAGVGILLTYEVGSTVLLGGTVGKRVMKIRVVDDATRQRASGTALLLRAFAITAPAVFTLAMWWTSVFVSWAAFALCVWLAWPVVAPGSDGRTRYDRLARTTVAKRERLAN